MVKIRTLGFGFVSNLVNTSTNGPEPLATTLKQRLAIHVFHSFVIGLNFGFVMGYIIFYWMKIETSF